MYQRLYNEPGLNYGSAAHDRCPGVRYLDLYVDWLISPVIDLGCGTGDTVRELPSRGLLALGIDQVALERDMIVGDVTDPNISERVTLTGNSAICIDAFEHMHDVDVYRVLSNMESVRRQAITIHTGSSTVHGVELHINRKPVEDWQRIIERWLRVDRLIGIDPQRWLFLCERKS